MFKEEENWFGKRILKPLSDTYYLGTLIITGEEVRDETFKLFPIQRRRLNQWVGQCFLAQTHRRNAKHQQSVDFGYYCDENSNKYR